MILTPIFRASSLPDFLLSAGALHPGAFERPFLKLYDSLFRTVGNKKPRITSDNGGTQVRAYSSPSVEDRHDHRRLPARPWQTGKQGTL